MFFVSMALRLAAKRPDGEHEACVGAMRPSNIGRTGRPFRGERTAYQQGVGSVVVDGLGCPARRRGRAVGTGAAMGSVDGPDFADFGDMVAEVLLDADFEGHHGGRAANARAVEADVDDAVGGDLYEFDVAAVGLHGRSDGLDDELDAISDGEGFAGGGVGVPLRWLAIDGGSHG